jgi:hypothetical protein
LASDTNSTVSGEDRLQCLLAFDSEERLIDDTDRHRPKPGSTANRMPPLPNRSWKRLPSTMKLDVSWFPSRMPEKPELLPRLRPTVTTQKHSFCFHHIIKQLFECVTRLTNSSLLSDLLPDLRPRWCPTMSEWPVVRTIPSMSIRNRSSQPPGVHNPVCRAKLLWLCSSIEFPPPSETQQL